MKKKWLDSEVEILRRLYPDTPTRIVSERLGRTEKQVYMKAAGLGIKKSEKYMSGPLSGQIRPGSNMGGKARFKKGHTPWNKGIEGYNPNNHETRFKPGNRNGQALNNLKDIGSERINKDGNRERKVSDTGVKKIDWRPVHNIVWEEHHGPIPDGHIVVFKTADKLNTDIENLELISRAENMRRNSIHRYPKELVSVIRVNSSLKKRITEAESEKQN